MCDYYRIQLMSGRMSFEPLHTLEERYHLDQHQGLWNTKHSSHASYWKFQLAYDARSEGGLVRKKMQKKVGKNRAVVSSKEGVGRGCSAFY